MLFLTLTALLLVNISSGQVNDESVVKPGMELEWKNDTLYTGTGLKLFVGQQLLTGVPSGHDGNFRAIISQKAAIVPSIWGQDKRYENAIENYVDSKKSKEKLKAMLLPGTSLTIRKIFLQKTGKPHFYMVILSTDKGECKADIKLALQLNELLVNP